jgi:AraC-like DNA-binding protein
MSMLAKFIDSLHVQFYRAAFRVLNSGHMIVGEEGHKVQDKGFYVFPAGQPIFVKHGVGEHKDLGQTGFISDEHRANYLRTVSVLEDRDSIKELFTVVAFDAMIYDAIPFFEVLEVPPFYLPPDEELGFLVRHITCENELEKLGRDKIMRNYMEEILIHICRYMESQADFRKYIDKLDFLTDRRLVDIVKYIRENLDKDLSNKAIANIAFISEDYVGQFFKSLTGKNLQDYIENQRLERALFLLRTQPDNIQEIAHRVGFKDPAYFSRRFKMKFGANANAIRHNKNQMV